MQTPVEPATLAGRQESITTIPSEILSSIFLTGKIMADWDLAATLTAEPEGSNPFDVTPTHTPFENLVSRVCTHFRNVAAGTPGLWTTIYVDATTSPLSLESRIKLSRACLLDVHVGIPAVSAGSVAGMIELIILQSLRWQSLRIVGEYEVADIPIIQSLCNASAPRLRELSIAAEDIEGVDMASTEVLNILQNEELKFVRLRGMALYLYRPRFDNVTVLHLDQTKEVPISYPIFKTMTTSSSSLAHLSVFGDIIPPDSWHIRVNDLPFPSLLSLRIYAITGTTYSGLLLAIDAPNLRSLTFKGMHEHDLDLVLQDREADRWSSLRSLVFCDFELSRFTYEKIFKVFKEVEEFYSLQTPPAKSELVKLLLEGEEDMQEIVWPKLHTVSFPADPDGQYVTALRNLIRFRKECLHPLSKVVLQEDLDEGDRDRGLMVEDGILIDVVCGLDCWPQEGNFPDFDDRLFS